MEKFGFEWAPSRRGFLKGAAVAGLGALTPVPWVFGATFPSSNINVFVPTREGGGADRNLRAFTSVWKDYLKTNFEPKFFPGAAGRVGYETYMGKAKADGYNLLFGNMGPEVLNWVVRRPTFNIDDYFYFARVDADPAIIFVSQKSKFKTIDDVIAEGKKRAINVGVSRLAHPASLGALALGRKTGVKMNLVPLSGGRNTRAGVATGEMDIGALPSGGIVNRPKSFRIIAVFDSKNPLPKRMPDAVVVNEHFKMDLPPLIAGARAFGIKTKAVEDHPDQYEILTKTLKKVYENPAYKKAIIKTKAPWEYIKYGGPEECKKYVQYITQIGEEYKSLLTGKS
jgi:tripartite-type tricarboxylate transporter receptor subunit TctC